MLALHSPALTEHGTQQASRGTRRAELQAVDGLRSVVAQRPAATEHVAPRVRQRRWKPRPISMTVLELGKRGLHDELDSGAGNEGSGLLKGGIRWRLFGRAPQDKDKDTRTGVKNREGASATKPEAPKKTLSSLRRSFSLRIRRNRPKDRAEEPEGASEERSRTHSIGEQMAGPPRPFSYLTGKALGPSNQREDDGAGMQFIQYRSKGKVKVMEVPLYPAKLTAKPAQEEPSVWQLIASHFRRKEQPSNGKCELPQSQSKETGKHPLARNKKPQTVAIETLAGIDFNKGQDSFVNSQEWTLSRSVPELKVGIVGNLSSGKSALVHRYLTGTYVQEESPEDSFVNSQDRKSVV